MLPLKENDRDTLITENPLSTQSEYETNVGFFFARPKSVHRGEEGYLGNQNYRVKAAEHERGVLRQDVLLSSVSPQVPQVSWNIVYSWKDSSTVSLGTMALTHNTCELRD